MELTKEEHIILIAEKLFAERGFTGTSTREICKEAGINISMISYYFGSKEQLYKRIFEYRMQQGHSFAKDILNQPNLNEWEKLCQLIDNFSQRAMTLRSFYTILQREQLANNNPLIIDFLKISKMSFLEFYRSLIKSGYNNKVFTKRPKLEHIHSTVTGTLFSSLNGMAMYKEFFKLQDDKNFDENYFEDMKEHLKNILKYLLGYHEK